MYAHFVKIFEEEGATNVVYGVDYAWQIQYYPELAIDLYPQDLGLKWVFFNIF